MTTNQMRDNISSGSMIRALDRASPPLNRRPVMKQALVRLTTNLDDSLHRFGFLTVAERVGAARALLEPASIVGRPIRINFAGERDNIMADVAAIERYANGTVYLRLNVLDSTQFRLLVIDGPLHHVTLAWTFHMDVTPRHWCHEVESVSVVPSSPLIGAGAVEWA